MNDKIISDVEYLVASKQLILYGHLCEQYTVILAVDGRVIGTAVLVERNSVKMLLGVHHVLEKIESAEYVQLIQKMDARLRDYPKYKSENFKVHYWDCDYKIELSSKRDFYFSGTVRDLAFVRLDAYVLSSLTGYKSFYPLHTDIEFHFRKNESLVVYGVTPYGKDLQYNVAPLGIVASYYEHSFIHSPDNAGDYIICAIKNDAYEVKSLGMPIIQSLGGLSGAGLWSIIPEQNQRIRLVGIGIAQFLDNGRGDFICHGFKSINDFFTNHRCDGNICGQ